MINFLSVLNQILYLIGFNFCFVSIVKFHIFPQHGSKDFKRDRIKRSREILIQFTILKTPMSKLQKSNDRYKLVRQSSVEWQRGEPRVSNFLKSYTSSRHARRQAVASRYVATLQQQTPLTRAYNASQRYRGTSSGTSKSRGNRDDRGSRDRKEKERDRG